MRIAPEIQSWGEGPTLRESPHRDSCTFEALAKQKKNGLDHSCNKHRSVYSKGRECPGSEKTALNKQREELVSQNKTDLSINCSDNLERFWSLKLCILE